MIQRSFCVFLLIRRNTNVTTIQRLHYYFIQKRLFLIRHKTSVTMIQLLYSTFRYVTLCRHYDTTFALFFLPRRQKRRHYDKKFVL